MAEQAGTEEQTAEERKQTDTIEEMAARVAAMQDSMGQSQASQEAQLAALQDIGRTTDAGFDMVSENDTATRGAQYVQAWNPNTYIAKVSDSIQGASETAAREIGRVTSAANDRVTRTMQDTAANIGGKIDEHKESIDGTLKNVGLTLAQQGLQKMNMGAAADMVGAIKTGRQIQGVYGALTSGVQGSEAPLQQFGQNIMNTASGRVAGKVGSAMGQMGISVVGAKIGSKVASKVASSGFAKVVGGAIGASIAPGVGAAVTAGIAAAGAAVNAVGTGITNLNRKYAQTGRSGAESGMYAIGTDVGLWAQKTFDPRTMFMSDEEKEALQQGALNRGYQYNSSTYNSYLDVTSNAMKKYNFSQSSAERIFDYRVRNLGESTAQVSTYLDTLAKSVKNSSESMDKLDEAITTGAEALTGTYGMTNTQSTELSQQLMSGQSQESQTAISTMLSNSSSLSSFMTSAQATGQGTSTAIKQFIDTGLTYFTDGGTKMKSLLTSGAGYKDIATYLDDSKNIKTGNLSTVESYFGVSDPTSLARVLAALESSYKESTNNTSSGDTSSAENNASASSSNSTAANSGDNGGTVDVNSLKSSGTTADQLDSSTYNSLAQSAATLAVEGTKESTSDYLARINKNDLINSYIQSGGTDVGGMGSTDTDFLSKWGYNLTHPFSPMANDFFSSNLKADSDELSKIGSSVSDWWSSLFNNSSDNSPSTDTNNSSTTANINLVVDGKTLTTVLAKLDGDQGAADGTSTRNGSSS